MLADLDRRVVARGAAAALLLAAPVGVATSLLADREGAYRGPLTILSLLLLSAFALGGFVAGREAPTLPAKHAAGAAVVAFVVVQVLGLVARLARGAPVRPVNIVFGALLAAVAGMVGGLLATRRRSPAAP